MDICDIPSIKKISYRDQQVKQFSFKAPFENPDDIPQGYTWCFCCDKIIKINSIDKHVNSTKHSIKTYIWREIMGMEKPLFFN